MTVLQSGFERYALGNGASNSHGGHGPCV